MKVIKRDVDLVGAAVVAGNGSLPAETKGKVVMMGFFQEKPGHEVRYQYKKSNPPASHLCPLFGEVTEYTKNGPCNGIVPWEIEKWSIKSGEWSIGIGERR